MYCLLKPVVKGSHPLTLTNRSEKVPHENEVNVKQSLT